MYAAFCIYSVVTIVFFSYNELCHVEKQKIQLETMSWRGPSC